MLMKMKSLPGLFLYLLVFPIILYTLLRKSKHARFVVMKSS